jgi:tyrosine-protein phosphatase 2/3
MHVTPMHKEIMPLEGNQTVIVRTLMLQNLADPFTPMREIIQLHYETWPDFGIPAEATSIVSLIRLLNDILSQRGKAKSAPVVVHCSAGCGRTGTFCTVDSVIHSLECEEGREDENEDIIFRNVMEIREQRMSLVQTLRQYVLCYECVLHYLLEKCGQ